MTSKFKNKSQIGNRIRLHREKLNLTRPELAKAIDVSLSALQGWETNEREPQASMILTIAEVLGVSPAYLLTGENSTTTIPHAKPVQAVKSEDADEEFEWIDDCRDVVVTAGYGGINGDYPNIKKTKIEKAWLLSRGFKAKDCGKYKVFGNSMDSTLRDEEDIIVHHPSKTLIDGQIFILNNKGAVLVKRVQLTFNGIVLISDNKQEYQPIQLTTEEANDLIVIGRVVRGYRDF
ncbi:TPA: XRE family transcriptional regulator [Pasteurella multocida]|uniref:XRE family transcriptional regulator n=1 Tax=Pasteurella multocida TaxID=747 RepID=UPI0038FC9CA7